jgi:hypothetical protein
MVIMKSSIFWDMKPCIPLKANRRFGGEFRLYIQGRTITSHQGPTFNGIHGAHPRRQHLVVLCVYKGLMSILPLSI